VIEMQEDSCVPRVRWFGTRDAVRHTAQREGNGAIADLLTYGRPLCDGGQAVKSSKGYGTERDAREIADGKPPSSSAGRIESGSGGHGSPRSVEVPTR
jgi:hypothetical protein